MLPIRLHLPALIISEFTGFLVGSAGAIGFWISGRFSDQLWLAGLVFLTAVVMGVMIPRTVFRHLVPARCDRPECQGAAFPRGSDPIIYVCRRCGNRTLTNVSENTEIGGSTDE